MDVGTTARSSSGRFATRLVAGMLVASLPITIVLALLLTSKASTSLTDATRETGESISRSVALRVEGWLAQRAESISAIAAGASGRLSDPNLAAEMKRVVDVTGNDFVVIESTDLLGNVQSASDPGFQIAPKGKSWFSDVVRSKTVLTSPIEDNGAIEWIIAEPVLDAGGALEGAVIGRLRILVLPELLGAELGKGEELLAVDAEHRVIYASKMGSPNTDADYLEAGGLTTKAKNETTTLALSGKGGSTAHFVDALGNDAIGGYDKVESLGWGIVVSKARSDALSAVSSQKSTAVVIVLIGAALTIAFSVWFARRTTRPLLRLAETSEQVAAGDLDARAEVEGASELRRLGGAFNGMVESLSRLVTQTGHASTEVNSSAAQLSATSEQLAATTTGQSAAVTEATATAEELARASSSIADTVEEVAAQATEAREDLERAEADMQTSSERTLALAERVNEIGAILTLINDIADQTNLLALNAAIEAARAGDAGRGFAVVADEVRQLAERSKASAAEIATITEGVHTETNATVMAMEKGAKQMQHGLTMLEGVTQAAEQVRLTTQQQRSATNQTVETMEQLSDASRQVSVTAQQIAEASASLAALAHNLEKTSALEHNGDGDVNGNGTGDDDGDGEVPPDLEEAPALATAR